MERVDLSDELRHLASEDLSVRQRLLNAGELSKGYNPEVRSVHRRNGARLEEILAEVECWPGYRLVGMEGSEAAFLIAHHDIANPALMRLSRALFSAAVAEADADPRRLAYLEDRIRYFEGRLQRYGTQVGWDDLGQFGPWPAVEEPERVDELRAALGLGPLADAMAESQRDRPIERPVSEVLSHRQQGEAFARECGWRTNPRS